MAWTHKITKKEYVPGKDSIFITILLTDDKQKVFKDLFVKNYDDLKRQIKNEIIKLDDLQTTFDNIPIDSGVDLKPTVSEIDPDKISEIEFSDLIDKRRRIVRGIDIGICGEEDLVAINGELKSKFKEEYINIL